jgi:hypothetical protein
VTLFMDVHDRLPEGATAVELATAHAADLRVQERFGVRYLKYGSMWKPARRFACLRRRTLTPRTPCTARRTASSLTRSTPSLRGSAQVTGTRKEADSQ